MNHVVYLKLKAPMKGHPEGRVIRVKSDAKGTPIDRFWRMRIKDGGCKVVLGLTKKQKEVCINA